jgi:hypothetical protein
MNPSKHIQGSEKLIATFGEWPTFHDAEVVLFSAERALPVKVGYNIARLVIHLRRYASTGEGTANYQMVLTKSILAKFVFSLACNLELFDFNHQNVIDSFTVSPIQTDEPANLSVNIESIWGFGGSFHCSAAELESVEVLPIV